MSAPEWVDYVDLGKSALIVVDMQNDFVHSDGACALNGLDVTKSQAIVPDIQRVIDAMHIAGRPVIFIKTTHDDSTNSPAWLTRLIGRAHPICVTGTWGTEYFGVAPVDGDIEVIKHRYSAFIGTDLDLKLRSMGVESILMTGVGTSVCVESTMRDGYMLDYYALLVTDATAGGSEQDYQGSLTNMSRGFGWLTDSVEVSSLLGALPIVEVEVAA
jgi:ureidoacrylate peracid hydrolase